MMRAIRTARRPPLWRTSRATSREPGRLTVTFFLLAMLLAAICPAGEVARADEGFVTRDGATFIQGGQPFRFVGVNAYFAAGHPDIHRCGATADDQAELDGWFMRMRMEAGVTVVRFWAHPAFLGFRDGGLALDTRGFDRVISAARRADVRVIPVLGDHWEHCDGYRKDDEWYRGGYRSPRGGQGVSYREAVAQIVTRYRDEPRIFGWELMNESIGAESALASFSTDMLAVVRAADPRHLRSLGGYALDQPGWANGGFKRLSGLPYNDFTSYHDYHNQDTIPLPAPVAEAVRIANDELHMPIIMGEHGECITACGDRPVWSPAQRARNIDAKAAAFLAAGGEGYLPWAWAPDSLQAHDFGRDGDDPLAAALKARAATLAGPPPPVPGPVASAGTVALTPPMGWNHYNAFGNTINEGQLREIADAMVANGMRDAGYVYFNIDDSWQGERDREGNIQANENFPSGIGALADYVHARGFKFGLYTTPAARSCGGKTGSAGHAARDVRSFASWGVDFIKLDWCGADYSPEGSRAIVREWQAAIAAAGRPMVLSVNAGSGAYAWVHDLANMWRVGDDICSQWTERARDDTYRCYQGQERGGIIDIVNKSNLRASGPLAGPGHWSDPDMLVVGTAGLSFDEAKSHFSIWAITAAPLIAGHDPRAMRSGDTASGILLNREVIAVDQDPLGMQGTRIRDIGGLQVWTKPLLGGDRAVVLFNTTDVTASIGVNWAELGLAGSQHVRDLWDAADLGGFADGYATSVPAHGVVMVRVSSLPSAAPAPPPSAAPAPPPSTGPGPSTVHTFPDVPGDAPARAAIEELAVRGIIRGYPDGRFGPDDPVLRAQMAALIARAMGWEGEVGANPFPDQGSVDEELWGNVGALYARQIARGYPDGSYRPLDPIAQVQVVAFISRAMVAAGRWHLQSDDGVAYPNVPSESGHRLELATYVHYVGALPGTSARDNPWASWDQPASRAWFAQALWPALR
ncbi:MAG TPA: S-layer homology domain-containing protein [Thermomicrobiales bacterium]